MRDLDEWNRVERACEIRFCAQGILHPLGKHQRGSEDEIDQIAVWIYWLAAALSPTVQSRLFFGSCRFKCFSFVV